MYRILTGKEPAPEHITPQWVLDDLAARGLDPGQPGYPLERIRLMRVRGTDEDCGMILI